MIITSNYPLSEENYAPENEAETRDYILLGARCCVVVVFLAAFVAFLVLVLRGRRLKNWRLYALCGLIYFAWLALSLYHVSLTFIPEAKPVKTTHMPTDYRVVRVVVERFLLT